MNRRMIFRILSKLLAAEGLLMLVPAAVSFLYGEKTGWWFVLVGAALAAAGFLGARRQVADRDIYAKDGFLIVGLSWVLWSAFGALPFVLSGAVPDYLDAFFETVSGFTTTGATILTDIEILPRGLLFWRSLTHWIGGMGVLVFVLAIVPLSGSRAMYIMRAEVPGPTSGKLVPNTMKTAKILYGIYLVLTTALVVLLAAGGMPLYDSLINAFGTAGTGGFAVKNASIAAYGSVWTEWVMTVFMLLFSLNFNLYYLVLLRQFSRAVKSEELRVFGLVVLAAAVLVMIDLRQVYPDLLTNLRYSLFQVASVISTSGFTTADFSQWPFFSQSVLFLLMFVGACAGSTGGGLKISRLMLLLRAQRCRLQKEANPRLMRIVRMDKKAVPDETVHGAYRYLSLYFVLMLVSFLLVAAEGRDFTTTFSSVVTCLNNVGPGLGPGVGPAGNFAALSPLSKLVLSLDMLLGRLEIFPILLLFLPSLWKSRIRKR